MYGFIYWLKVLAAVLITNSHYADIWPVSALAMGGPIGNCIYFFVSGFCLCNIKEPFYRWYPKRMVRIYPAVFIIMAFRLLFAGDKITTGFGGYVRSFIYPTWFHFVGSILLLYILFYVVRYMQKRFEKIKTYYVVCGLFALFAVIYIFFFDKSYFHIDDVQEKTVRFMFFASMLLGASLRERYEKISEKISPFNVASLFVLGGCYFAFKMFLDKNILLVNYFQLASPVICVLFIYCVVLLFIKFEKKGVFSKMPDFLKSFSRLVAGMTLEIYLCQNLIIDSLSKRFSFPINFIVVTSLIAVFAYAINMMSRLIQKPFNKLLAKK